MSRPFDRPARPGGLSAGFALPAGFVGLLVVSAALVGAKGRWGAHAPTVLSACVVAVVCLIAEPAAAPPMAVIGWTTVAGFSRPPYADLHARGTLPAAVTLALTALTSMLVGVLVRARAVPGLRRTGTAILWDCWSEPSGGDMTGTTGSVDVADLPRRRTLHMVDISARRTLLALALGAVLLPALTAVLAGQRENLALIDDLLLYLVLVIGLTLVGGFWPAMLAAVAASLLLNWYFTPPVHTWTIEAPQNILALLLFTTVAVSVSSVVHLAARRAALARAHSAEARTLLMLARTVLGGDDSPQAVLDHLHSALGISADLAEWAGDQWVRVTGAARPAPPLRVVPAGPNLVLRVYGAHHGGDASVVTAFAAQAGAALERQRLRVAAAQAEALAAGNQMRTALLAAVGHDLRTPLASVKAAVSTLRQDDVVWSAADREALLETIEEGADRLTGLIANLLDMSRINSGAVTPHVRPTDLHGLAPLLGRSLDSDRSGALVIDLPDELPLIRADAGLLERALANLVTNALRYSPPGHPPTLRATAGADAVTLRLVDHGPGVPAAQRERIFAPFQQLDDRHTGSGVGLGLAVARGFIEAMGGRLNAEATPGGGLTMVIRLPAHAGTVEPAAPV